MSGKAWRVSYDKASQEWVLEVGDRGNEVLRTDDKTAVEREIDRLEMEARR